MVISSVIFGIICGFLFKPANLSVIDYGPIKIIVRESSDALTDMVHQGENFYFKHYVNFPPSHFEAIMSLIQQDASRLEEETENLQGMLKPFIRSGSNLSNDRISKVEPLPKPSPLPVPVILMDEEPELVTSNQRNPAESILPQISINDMSAVIEGINLQEPNEYKGNLVIMPEETLIKANIEEPMVYKENVVVPEVPVLIDNNYAVIEKVKLEDPKINEESFIMVPEAPNTQASVDSNPVTGEEVWLEAPKVSEEVENTLPLSSQIIPEAPVLPLLSTNDYAISVEQLNVKKTKVHEDSVAANPEGPVLPEPVNNSPAVVDEMIIEEPKINKNDVIVVPESPVFAPLLVKNFPAVIEEFELEEPKIFAEAEDLIHLNPVIIPETLTLSPLKGFPADGEVEKFKELRVSEDPDNTLYLSSLTISEAPVLPLPVSSYKIAVGQVNVKEPKEHEYSVEAVSEAPQFHVLVHNNSAVAEEVKVEEPQVYIERIIEVSEAPLLPLLPVDNNSAALEQVNTEEPKINKEKIVAVTGPSSVKNSPVYIEEVKLEDQKLSKESENVLHLSSIRPIVSEIPILSPLLSVNNYPADDEEGKLEQPKVSKEPENTLYLSSAIIPEAPVLPLMSINSYPAVDEEVIVEEPNIAVIPEAPMLPPVLVNNNSAVLQEITEEPKISENTKNTIYLSSLIIPEYPVLSEYSLTTDEKQVKEQDPASLKQMTTNQRSEELSTVEAKSTMKINHDESKSVASENENITENFAVQENDDPKDTLRNLRQTSSEIEIIPETPRLPPLSLRDLLLHEEKERLDDFLPHIPESYIPSKIDTVPKYISEKNDNSGVAFRNNPKISHAPSSPPVSSNEILVAAEEKEKLNEDLPHLLKVLNYPNLGTIPEAPVLPPLSLADFPYPKK